LNPVRIDTASIITDRPIAIPIIAITFIGRENEVPSRRPFISLWAMKYGRFIR
jgi:hypothetical protein